MYTDCMDKKKILLIATVLGSLLIGCSGEKEDSGKKLFYNSMNDSTEAQTEVSEPENSAENYMIVGINSANETMRVFRLENGLEYQYYYSLSTEFLNKYGDRVSVSDFSVGDIIYLQGTDNEGKVATVQKSDEVWVYDDISKFSIDEEKGIMSIADSNYKIDDNTYVFSNDQIAEFADITKTDELSVVGIDKQILSVNITTGHGTIKLANTELFEGSFLQLNNNIFAEITKDMEMEIPEGHYVLAIANDGWGGSCEIDVKRGEETCVDLEQVKGPERKACKILFEIDIEGAKIFIDNKEVDYSDIVEVSYGKHSLMICADGYDNWTRTLYVNSDEATISLTLDEEETDDSSNENNSQSNSQQSSSEQSSSDQASSEKEATVNNSNNTGSSTNNTDKSDLSSLSNDELVDYLSTISSLLSSMK